MKIAAPFNFQFSIFNLKSKFNFKFLIVLLLATCYLVFNTSSASAQTSPYTVPNTNPDVPKNLHTWTQNVMIEVMSAMSCQLSGIDPTDPKGKCLGVDQKTGKIGYVENGGGAIGVAGHMIGMLYTPPLNSGDYFKYLAGNFGIAKSAEAASGFEGLKPVQKVWVAFRNVVYLLFVVVFVVIGLAIMLRIKIDPRTVMTIQNQIPKIIVGLLLVTFSFAIAGFLIDLMYVVMFLSYEIIASANVTDVTKLNPLNLAGQSALQAAGLIKDGGIFGIANHTAWSIKGAIADILQTDTCGSILRCFVDRLNPVKLFTDILDPNQIGNPINYMINFISNVFAGITFYRIAGLQNPVTSVIPLVQEALALAQSSVKFAVATGAAELVYSATQWTLRVGLPWFIPFLIIIIALTFALFRLWFTLILAYVGILLDVVFAPFWIVGALLPGSPIGFSAWLRSIIANLAAFPAAIVMLLLAKVFIDGFGTSRSPDDFVPPLIGVPSGTDVLGNFIGLGILLMTPGVVAMIKAAIKAPSIPAGGPIGAAIGVGGGVLTGPAGALKQGFALSFGQFAASKFGLGGAPKNVPGSPRGK